MAQFTMSITNRSKPLDIDLRGVCLVVTQPRNKLVVIGNGGLGIEKLQSSQPKIWNLNVHNPPARLVGLITNPPDLTKYYNTGVRGIYAYMASIRENCMKVY